MLTPEELSAEEQATTPVVEGPRVVLNVNDIFQDQFNSQDYHFTTLQPGLEPRLQVGQLFLTRTPHPLNKRKIQHHLCEVVAVSPDPKTGFTRYGLMFWTGDYLGQTR